MFLDNIISFSGWLGFETSSVVYIYLHLLLAIRISHQGCSSVSISLPSRLFLKWLRFLLLFQALQLLSMTGCHVTLYHKISVNLGWALSTLALLTFWANSMWGAVLCIVGCLATSMIYTQYMSPHSSCENQKCLQTQLNL